MDAGQRLSPVLWFFFPFFLSLCFAGRSTHTPRPAALHEAFCSRCSTVTLAWLLSMAFWS